MLINEYEHTFLIKQFKKNSKWSEWKLLKKCNIYSNRYKKHYTLRSEKLYCNRKLKIKSWLSLN
jgi:hypothetical protein